MKRKTYSEAIPVMLFASEKIEGEVLDGVAAVKDYCSNICSQDREIMVIIAMTAKNRVIKRFVHSIGDVDTSAVYARILFRDLLALAATPFILVHNHPSGDVRPSSADLFLTEDIAVAGKLVGINLLDHLILGPDACYSFSENELIEKYRSRSDNAYRFGLKKVVHERS